MPAQRFSRCLVAAACLVLFGCALPSPDCPNCSPLARPPSVTIAAVGDTNGYNLLRFGPDTQDPLEDVRDLLRQHDVFIFNYEGVILSETPSPGRCRAWPRQSSFHNPPWIAGFLRPTPVAIATLATNHILECGPEGIEETIRELSRQRILTVGAGRNADEACRPVRVAVNGVRLAILAYLAMNADWFLAKSERAGAASWDECRGEQIGRAHV